ncbi:centrosomal protein of 290 kDa-like [Gigantopelta aegis]|uniref:centrosomal protein of 290 kDa-like n=1 Tax=Gigantopelta aegis TaxID=1735272 RepID=UPI001B88A64D|nr:centrosomal protein of 290 kDa-like [Gigantopelta aegis]
MQHISHEKECLSLRQQLIDFQMQTDEKTIIGKLHRHIVQLQVSEGTAVRKLAEATKKITKLEAHVLRCEQRIDDKDQTLFHSRSESQNKARYLKRNLQELRIQFAGAVPLSKQEKFAKNMLQLRQDKGKLEQELKEVKNQKTELEDRIAELQLQRGSLQDLIATLKDGRGAAKVAEWHSKIDVIRLAELKQKRLNSKLNQQIKYLEGVIQSHELTIADLEADNVRVIKEFEERQLRWEQREVDLERQLDSMEKQSSEIAGAASQFEEALGRIPDAKLPLANQLEEAIVIIKRNVKIILDTQAESKLVKERNKELEKRAREAERTVLEREKLISELRLRMPATADRDEIILKATTKVSEAMSRQVLNKDYESEQALKIAQSTMGSLQARIAQKEETIVKYQELLKQAREEMHEMIQKHQQELHAMQQKVHMNNDAAFNKFREATQQFLARQTTMKGPSSKQIQRLNELEDTVADQANMIAALTEKLRQKEEEIIAVRVKLQQQDRHIAVERDQLADDLRTEIAQKEQEVQECRRLMADMRKEMEILNEEIAVLKQSSSKTPTATMKNLVERLKNQLALKEKQHQALTKALTELRADMVTQAQDNVKAHAEDAGQERNIQRLIDQHTKQMAEQIEDLQTQMDRLKKELKKKKDSESSLQSELEDIKEELAQKERSFTKCKRDKQRLEQEVDELEKKVERMNTIRSQKVGGEFEKQQELDEMRRRVRLLEDELRKRQHTAEKPYEKEDKPKPDDAAVKWEESKKWQRTVDKMKTKMKEKDQEMEKLQKTLELTKAALERSVANIITC